VSLIELSDKEFRKVLRKLLGFKPGKLQLYKRAFIHKSATYVDHKNRVVNNERLEFLGDAILDAVVGDYVFRNFPTDNEGFLTKIRSRLVNASTLYLMAKSLKLQELILITEGTHVNKKYICGDAVEALIGAIYLDKGFDKAYDFIVNRLLKLIDTQKIITTEDNFKSLILQYAQKKHINISFSTEKKTKDTFVSILSLEGENFKGEGPTKKEAEQKASEIAYKKLMSNEKKN